VLYIGAAFAALARYVPLEVRLTLDGQPWAGRVLLVAASNAPTYGAGLKIAPAAEMDDGWMDITVVHDMSWTRLVDAILPILRTGLPPAGWPEMRHLRARRARIETSRPAVFHGDGELLGETPVELEVLPGAVEILCPSRGKNLTQRR
jgi:diacylglycerol kinase (ATP)